MPKINVMPASEHGGKNEKKVLEANYEWTDFTQNSSLHGIKHAFEPNLFVIRRIIWLVGLLSMFSALLYIVSNLVIDYYKYPHQSNVKITVLNKVDFPQVTICNVSPFNRSLLDPSPKFDDILLSMSPLLFLAPVINFSDPEYAFANEVPSREEYLGASFDLTGSFLSCSHKGEKINCDDLFEYKLTKMGNCFTTKTKTTTGVDLRSTEMIGSETGLQMHMFLDQWNYVYNLQASAGFKVYLHDPSEEPDMTNKGFLVSPGFTTYASVKKFKYKHLPYPHKAFGNVYCLDTKSPSFVNPLKHKGEYDVTGCQNECQTTYMLDKCGCVQFTDIGNASLCSLRQTYECYHKNKVNFNIRRNEMCNCQTPCEYTSFEAQLTTAYYPAQINEELLMSHAGFTDIRKNFAELRIFYETLMETEIAQVPVYTLDNIVATLGGQMGIFLGASVLTVSEFIEFIIIKIWFFFGSMCCPRGNVSKK